MLSEKLARLLQGLKKNSKMAAVQVQSAVDSEKPKEVQDSVCRKLKRAKLMLEKRTALKNARLNLQKSKNMGAKSIAVQTVAQMDVIECNLSYAMDEAKSQLIRTYRVQGDMDTQQVSDLQLQQRVREILDTTQAINAEIADCSAISNRSQVQSDDGLSEDEESRHHIRYFDAIDSNDEQSRLIKCYRCGKRGHSARSCLRQEDRCLYCLGKHLHHRCRERVCFRCSEVGHIAQECLAGWVRCRRCGRRGHIDVYCGSLLFLDYSELRSERQFREYYRREDLARLRCLKEAKMHFGHFNCFQYSERTLRPYQCEDDTVRQGECEQGAKIQNAVTTRSNGNQNEKQASTIRSYQGSVQANPSCTVGRCRNTLKGKIFKSRAFNGRGKRW